MLLNNGVAYGTASTCYTDYIDTTADGIHFDRKSMKTSARRLQMP